MTERKSLPLFAALDLNTLREARQTMDMLSGVVDAIKIGPRLYAQGGAHFLKEIVDHGCMSWGVDARLTAKATEMARAKWDGPLWVKLTPQAPDIPAVARAAELAGASALVASNTWLGMAIDTKRGVPVFARRVAGVSGPAVFPLALRVVWDAAGAVKIPVIGCGGVDSADAALAMIMAGAAAVEVGASLFAGFGVLKDIHEGLEAAVARWGVKNVSELVGKARETR